MGKLWRRGQSSSKGWKFIDDSRGIIILLILPSYATVLRRNDESFGMATGLGVIYAQRMRSHRFETSISCRYILARDGTTT
jgi:hypothetical protein